MQDPEELMGLDTLIVTIGDIPDVGYIASMGIEVTESGTLRVDRHTLATSRAGVFAGGDVVTGPNTVVEAIAAGKKAAVMIGRYLSGAELRQPGELRLPRVYVEPVEVSAEEMMEAERVELPMIPAAQRVRSFDEVERTLSAEDATHEARRCQRCDLEFTLSAKGGSPCPSAVGGAT